MTSGELRKNFLQFFKERGHAIVPSSSLLSDDPSVLLTTAGMQQFKPYFTGKADPERDFGSLNTASIQKSFRTSDIDEVGDESHLTFFEMMGNFSFGGYFKQEAIGYAKEFLESLGLTIQYVTIFAGDESTPRDKESKRIWESLGISDVYEYGREENFWGPTGSEGPCGPTTEIYINDTEIWNIVFNEYYCKPGGALELLKSPGIDTGMGLERLAMVSQGKKNIFETDLFQPIISLLPDIFDEKRQRVVADHLRAVIFLIAYGVRPSNKETGYILRRLLRRILVYEYTAQKDSGFAVENLLKDIIDFYSNSYPELGEKIIRDEVLREKERFQKSIARGLRELEGASSIDAQQAFKLYESFGLPYEIVKEFGGEKASALRRKEFEEEFRKHQKRSRAGQEAKFGGHGLLLDTGELKARDEEEVKTVTRLHTATHLLQAALQEILGKEVQQAGSDITAERTRFDFTYPQKVAPEDLQKIEDWVNDIIRRDLPVIFEEMPYEEAIKSGALYFFKQKYPQVVRVYRVYDSQTGKIYSQELCGGPHVEQTGEVGRFRIIKEEAVSAGVRRIRATVE